MSHNKEIYDKQLVVVQDKAAQRWVSPKPSRKEGLDKYITPPIAALAEGMEGGLLCEEYRFSNIFVLCFAKLVKISTREGNKTTRMRFDIHSFKWVVRRREDAPESITGRRWASGFEY